MKVKVAGMKGFIYKGFLNSDETWGKAQGQPHLAFWLAYIDKTFLYFLFIYLFIYFFFLII